MGDIVIFLISGFQHIGIDSVPGLEGGEELIRSCDQSPIRSRSSHWRKSPVKPMLSATLTKLLAGRGSSKLECGLDALLFDLADTRDDSARKHGDDLVARLSR